VERCLWHSVKGTVEYTTEGMTAGYKKNNCRTWLQKKIKRKQKFTKGNVAFKICFTNCFQRCVYHVCLFVCFPVVTTHCGCIITARWRALDFSFSRFLGYTQQRATVGRTPLDVWSIRRRDLYLTTHNTHNRQTSMPVVGFEPTISAGERPKTYALDRAVIGTGVYTTCRS
jgi:hypothetical protein